MFGLTCNTCSVKELFATFSLPISSLNRSMLVGESRKSLACAITKVLMEIFEVLISCFALIFIGMRDKIDR